ncbi:MAG: DNA polymerase I [Eubacteriales bacterium]|nr:DNA polymerase I [Eubacteriales bacterium]
MAGALLVDGNSLMYRAFFALPPLTAPDGTPTNALYGFMSMLLRVIADERPEYAAVAFDVHGPTFRHERFAEYKGTRAPTPDELRPQFPLVKEALRAMGIAVLEKQGFEADDLVGTASRVFSEQGVPSLIVTGDRDSFQLTGEGVEVLYTKRGITDTERVTESSIIEKYGILPRQLIDMKALCGDTSDNIPGVPGIGEKTAAKLVAKYGDLESCLAAADTQEKGKLRERLLENAGLARECRFLAEIDRHAPIDFAPSAARIAGLSGGLVFLKKYELKSLSQRLNAVAALYSAGDGENPVENSVENAEKPVENRVEIPVEEIVENAAELLRAVDNLPEGAPVAVILEETKASVCARGRSAVSVSIGQKTLLDMGVSAEDALRALAPVLEGAGPKILCGEKMLRTQAKKLGIELRGEVYDPALAAYVLAPQRKSFEAGALLEEAGFAQNTGAAALFALREQQEEQLRRDGLESLLHEVEEPLSGVLYRMEQIGFKADGAVLEELGRGFSAKEEQLQAEIHAVAGYPVNIQSPKQLAVLLYDELGLDNGKKGAQARTTGAEVLEAMAGQHPVVEKILEFRKYAKLNGTYIEGLLRLLHAPGGDGRIHTRFDQTSTATGRLSSLEPNLQNIPVRTELGRDIRRAFVAQEGWLLVDADYSQIELRVLAHMAHDERMIEAFRSGEDIHRRTAAEIYGVPIEEVTGQMRSAAKAVNFGIVYGISDFGLSRNTGLTRYEAADFMKTYLARYPAIGVFMQEAVAQARSAGYARTMLGRRRYIPEMSSANRNIRSFGERAAMNSPIQGTAADIIKLAMIAVEKALQGMQARLILQVHDELIVEAPQHEAERAAQILKEEMEKVMLLDAPLRADVSVGRNWLECK